MVPERYRTIVADPPWPYEARFMGPRTAGGAGARQMPYPTMSLAEIAALPVGGLAAPAAHLYVWTTQRYLWDTKAIVEGWGFRAVKVLTWCKDPVGQGPGGSFANTTEFCVFGRARLGATIRRARESAGMSQNVLDELVRGKVTRIAKRWEDDDCLPSPSDWDQLRSALPALMSVGDLSADPALCSTTWWRWPRGEHSAKPDAFLDVVESVSPSPFVELFARRARFGWDYWGDQSLGTAEMAA